MKSYKTFRTYFRSKVAKKILPGFTKSVPYSPETAPEETELYVNDLELFLQWFHFDMISKVTVMTSCSLNC